MRRVACALLALFLTLCFLASSALSESPTPDTIPEPTLSPDAEKYDANHPENLSEDQLYALSAILISQDTGEVIFSKNPDEIRYPASTTKILTVLLAILFAEDLNETVTVTETAMNIPADSSTMGLQVDEEIRLIDVLYGTMLLSGNDGANVIAETVSGSIPAFVDLMNAKLDQLGIGDTSHFTNCVGLFDENHYTTAHDMAVIMAAALDNELCAEVLKTRERNIEPNEFHPEGQWLYDKFIGWIEDQEINGTIIGAKTGYVMESGNCCVSALLSNGGHRYILVTGKADSSLMERQDHVAIYQNYTN